MANSPQNRDAVIDVDLSKGIDADSLEKQGMSWAQNIEYRVNRIEVRGGFGTLAQFGTTMNSGRVPNPFGPPFVYGYGPPLGATLQLTNQGHVQILSVHALRAFTGTDKGQYLDHMYALSVYDVTTGRRAEHVFRAQTQWMSNLPGVALQSNAQPGWREAPVDQVPSFSQLSDLQYICLPGQGVWVYRPIDAFAVDQRLQTTPGTLQSGDSAWVELVTPVNGVYATSGAVYFNASSFPLPSAMCSFQNRMVYASGRKIYFSDPDRPDNVQANSFYAVPTERPITALASVKGVILIFTTDETWMYQPSDPTQTGLISGGNIYNLSRSRGCLTAQSLTLMQDSVVFMDRRGVYVCDGGTSISKISDNIDTWFALPEQIQNPLSSYLTQAGLNTLSNQQPRAFIDMQSQLYRGTFTWDPQNQLLFLTFDDLTLVFCPDFGWSVYLYETTAVVQSGVPRVGLQQKLVNPIMFANAGDLYMIGGADVETYGDIQDSSVYILKQGRGGALDRSSVTQEDLRQPYQFWFQPLVAVRPQAPSFYIAPPILLPDNYNDSAQGVVMTQPTWLVPLFAANESQSALSDIELVLQFNSTDWQPVLISPSFPNYAYLVPPPRLASKLAFTDLQVYNGGTPSVTGNRLHVKWNGAGAPNNWSAWPKMGLIPGTPQPLLYLLMQRRTGTAATTSTSMNWDFVSAQVKTDAMNPWVQCNGWVAQETGQPAYPQQDLGDNTHAQPVDWAISTPLLGDGKAQYKARGAAAVIQSYGRAAAQQVPGWLIGPYGSMTTSDYKDFAAQQIDYGDGDPHEDPDKHSVRPRIQAASAVEPTTKTGNNVATWSSTGMQSAGNLLIDDAATDSVIGSESVRGERFRTMLFGCMNANGEDIKIARVRILTRLTGGLRRTGRTGLT